MWEVFSGSNWPWKCNRPPVPEWHALGNGVKENVYKLYHLVFWNNNEEGRLQEAVKEHSSGTPAK